MVPAWVRIYRLVFGLIALYAVYNNYREFDDPHFWDFFTNQSNILAGVVLLLGSVVLIRRDHGLLWDLVRGSAVISMLVTGLVYGLLVGSFYNPFDGSVIWSSSVLHQLMPIVMLLDLLLVPLSRRVPWWSVIFFVTFPLIYLGVSLERGDRTGWYPYDFIDPTTYDSGMSGVVQTSVGLLAAFILLGALLIGYSRNVRHAANT